MKKNVFSVLIYVVAFALVIGAVISVAATSFNDVPADAYYADAAERMADRGILSGFGDGYYYGDQTVTRAQVAALVCKMLGKVDEATALAGKTVFADVPETSWCTGYVNYAVANKIINGDGDGNFRPDDPVKYEEVIKVVVCVLKLDGDVKIDPSDWSKEYIKAANDADLLLNLIGKKAEYMKRSDIAVICDAAMNVLDKAEESEVETTTKKQSGGSTGKPATTTATSATETEPEPEETTSATTSATTEQTTTARPVHTAPIISTSADDYDGPDVDPDYTTGEDEGELV